MATCPYCGMIHNATCPKIKAIEYYPDGSTKRVEFRDYAPSIVSSALNPNISTTGGQP